MTFSVMPPKNVVSLKQDYDGVSVFLDGVIVAWFCDDGVFKFDSGHLKAKGLKVEDISAESHR